MTFPRPLDEAPRREVAQEVTRRAWSSVSLLWEGLGGLAPARSAVVVGAGSWGTAVATLLARGGARVQLVCRSREQADELRAARVNAPYLPGIELPAGISICASGEEDLAAADFLCMAVPSRSLGSALDSIAPRLPRRLGVLVLTKGLVGHAGDLPSSAVAERTGTRPVACLGGPGHALEAVRSGASLVVASPEETFAAVVAGALRRGGVHCTTSPDLVGTELAGVAKNAAALAAGAALPAGANAAGAAAGRIYAECHALAAARGGAHESFTGLAGAGDLVATVLAATSRNRRAGELLAAGASPQEIHERLGQVPEALYVLPALARAMRAAGVSAPATDDLAGLVEGRIEAGRWAESARRAPRRSRAA
jgi:glycerol-3-phosphate dehydrogenase